MGRYAECCIDDDNDDGDDDCECDSDSVRDCRVFVILSQWVGTRNARRDHDDGSDNDNDSDTAVANHVYFTVFSGSSSYHIFSDLF